MQLHIATPYTNHAKIHSSVAASYLQQQYSPSKLFVYSFQIVCIQIKLHAVTVEHCWKHRICEYNINISY